MASKSFKQVRIFDTMRDAQRALNYEICVEYRGQGLKYKVVECNGAKGTVLDQPGKFAVQLFNRETGAVAGVATETIKRGVSFTKPVSDSHRETHEQSVLLDGAIVGTLECVYDLVDQGTCQTNYVRVGTEEYVLSFRPGHPFAACEFHFEVGPAFKSAENAPEEGVYGVMYPTARKALAAAKRFAKAVL
jgi:hypothetical protein